MTTTASQEIELKFSVTDTTPVPNLENLGAIKSVRIHNLHATYYDTEDLRLFRAKITLRHRTGGKDDGWHIKFPGLTHRMELQAPDSKEPTDDFLEPVRAIIRDRPLIPIATIDNERHETIVETGEFVDDHVTAISLLRHGKKTTWREWEFEFHKEPDSTTYNHVATLMRSTGAMEATSPSKLRTALGSSVRYAPIPTRSIALESTLPLRNIFTTLHAYYHELIRLDPYMRGLGTEKTQQEFFEALLSIRSVIGLCYELGVGEIEFHEELSEDLLRIDALLTTLNNKNNEEYLEFLRSYDYYALLDDIEVILEQKWEELADQKNITTTAEKILTSINHKNPTHKDLSQLAVFRTACLAIPKGAALARTTTKTMKYMEKYIDIITKKKHIDTQLAHITSTNEAFQLGRTYAHIENTEKKKHKEFLESYNGLTRKFNKKIEK